jgi:small subunit ribosomal protein S2
MPKKEALILSRELEKLQRNLGGIRNMTRMPDAVFIIDTKKEHIGVTEANKLGLPIVAVVDTNCDPDVIQYVIPGNDDAIRSGTLLCRVIADAVEEGRLMAAHRSAKAASQAAASMDDPEAEARRASQQADARRQAALQAQEREARLATPAPAEAAPPAEAAAPAEAPAPQAEAANPAPAEAAAPAEVPAPAEAPAPAPAEAEAPAEAPAAAAPTATES